MIVLPIAALAWGGGVLITHGYPLLGACMWGAAIWLTLIALVAT